MSHDTQEIFAAALLDPEKPVPEGTLAWNGPRPLRRFDVYRNNFISGLVRALASRYPATERLVGQEFFTAMAQEFVRRYPPCTPVLFSYGDDFPTFVENFEPAKDVGYLPDVGRLEAARGRAYHAADASPLDPSRLGAVIPDNVMALCFAPHPSLSIVRSRYPVATIWAMNSDDAQPEPIRDWRAEDVLVVRPDMAVDVHRLSAGGAVFLSDLAAGVPLGRAVVAAMQDAPDFEPTAMLSFALKAGVYIEVF